MNEDLIAAAEMFSSLSPTVQEEILELMRSMVKSNEENGSVGAAE